MSAPDDWQGGVPGGIIPGQTHAVVVNYHDDEMTIICGDRRLQLDRLGREWRIYLPPDCIGDDGLVIGPRELPNLIACLTRAALEVMH